MACLALALRLAAPDDARAQEASDPKKIIKKDRISVLLALDAEARDAFAKKRPGVLPELKWKLPKASATSFSWVDFDCMGPARNQKAEDCWANAVTQAVECNWNLRNGKHAVLSPQPLLDRAQNQNDKGFARGKNLGQACEILLKHGAAPLDKYPYTGKPAKFKTDVKMTHRIIAWGDLSCCHKDRDKESPKLPDAATVQKLKEALLQHGPLAVSIVGTSKFGDLRGGVLSEKLKDDAGKGNHDVLLVGWDDRKGKKGAWRIRNSYGPGWGENGYGWIAYGSNLVGWNAVWVKAQCLYYRFAADEFAALVPDAEPLPTWTIALPGGNKKK
jgi:C1A family cysteine protease